MGKETKVVRKAEVKTPQVSNENNYLTKCVMVGRIPSYYASIN